MDSEQWYYTNGEETIGPFSPDRLVALRSGGIISDDTLVCREGCEDWMPFAEFRQSGLAPSLLHAAPERVENRVHERGTTPPTIPKARRKPFLYLTAGFVALVLAGTAALALHHRRRPTTSAPAPDRTASPPTGKASTPAFTPASTPNAAASLPVIDVATLQAAYKKAAESGKSQIPDWEKEVGRAEISSGFDLKNDWAALMQLIKDWQSLVGSQEMTVTQKLGPDLYEVHSRTGIFILQTSATRIKSAGRFAAPIRYVETMGITDKNGFNRDVEVYEEVIQTNPREVADALRQATYSLIANLRKHPAKDEDIARYYGALVKVEAESRIKKGQWFDDDRLVYLLLNERFKGEGLASQAEASPPPGPDKTPSDQETPRPNSLAERDKGRPESPTPDPSRSRTTPEPKRRLAKEGTFYLLQYASAKTAKGVYGFEPGCEVRRVGPGKQPGTMVVTDGQCQLEIATSLLTNDLNVALAVSSADQAQQLKAAAERDRQEAAGNASQRRLLIEHAGSVEAAERQRRQDSGIGGRVTPLNQAP